MALFLLKLLFSTISSSINLVSWIVFSGAARLLVRAIQVAKVPREAMDWALELVANLVKMLTDKLSGMLMEGMNLVVSTCFDLVKDGMAGAVESGTNAAVELVDKLKTALDEMSQELPEVLEGFADMVWNIVVESLYNSLDAMRYVWENV